MSYHKELILVDLEYEVIIEREFLERYKILEENILKLREIVNKQAEDYGLWFIPTNACEDYLQRALRRLHHVIESSLDSIN